MPETNEALRDRVERERASHTEDDVLARNRQIKARFRYISSYPSFQRLFKRIEEVASDLKGRVVLDYGCGRGNKSIEYLGRGASVVGIDISQTYIDDASAKARAAGFDEELFEFKAMDAHDLTFAEGTFDLVIGIGILHHLQLDVALRELHRVLRRGGRVLLLEPLADNPLLKVFRALTPHARTEDEEPLSGEVLRTIAGSGEWEATMQYCGIVEAPVALLVSAVPNERWARGILRLADRVETWIHRRGVLLSWNQYVLLDLKKSDRGVGGTA